MNQIITQSKGVNIAFLDEVFESLSYENIEVVIGLIKKVYMRKNIILNNPPGIITNPKFKNF